MSKILNYACFALFISFAFNYTCRGQSIINGTDILWYTAIFQGVPSNINTEVIKLDEEVIINDTSYYTVLRSIDGDENPSTDFGFLREDSGRVFYRRTITEREYLFYDYTVEVGDTVFVYGLQEKSETGLFGIEMSLDSVSIQDFYGYPREVYHFKVNEGDDNWAPNEKWIKGIGSDQGLLRHFTVMLGYNGYELRCVYDQDQLIFKNHLEGDCILLTSEANNRISHYSGPEFYPNPASELIFINSPTKLSSLSICNAEGSLIYKIDCPEVNKITVDISTLLSGLYLISFTIQDGSVHVQKLLIQ